MKKSEVPQDKSNLKSKGFKELCYAVNDEGEYTTEKSSGWEPKTIALSNTMKDINDRVNIAKEKVLLDKISPIAYYMELAKMDLPILASYVGFWRWRVKRHFKPNVFSKLSNRVLLKYAKVFNITIAQLKDIDHGN